MWYYKKRGRRLKLCKPSLASNDAFWCDEGSGYLNIVKKEDAVYIGKTICKK